MIGAICQPAVSAPQNNLTLQYIFQIGHECINCNSFNVKGLHSPIKRKKVLLQLRQSKCQVALLQETQLSDAEHKKLNKSWADKVYYSSHCSGRKRGVAILIHRQINFIETLVHKDREGRFLLVNGIIDVAAVSFYKCICAQ